VVYQIGPPPPGGKSAPAFFEAASKLKSVLDWYEFLSNLPQGVALRTMRTLDADVPTNWTIIDTNISETLLWEFSPDPLMGPNKGMLDVYHPNGRTRTFSDVLMPDHQSAIIHMQNNNVKLQDVAKLKYVQTHIQFIWGPPGG
jgi:hypothetical protein